MLPSTLDNIPSTLDILPSTKNYTRAFPVCTICFIEIIHDKWCLIKASGKLKWLNYNATL